MSTSFAPGPVTIDIDDADLCAPQVGHEMTDPNAHGLYDGEQMMQDPRFQKVMSQMEEAAETDAFDADALAQRKREREEILAKDPEARAAHDKRMADAGKMPDIISYGFCKLVYDFLEALHKRFPKRPMLARTMEYYWKLCERCPVMPFQKFNELVEHCESVKATVIAVRKEGGKDLCKAFAALQPAIKALAAKQVILKRAMSEKTESGELVATPQEIETAKQAVDGAQQALAGPKASAAVFDPIVERHLVANQMKVNQQTVDYVKYLIGTFDNCRSGSDDDVFEQRTEENEEIIKRELMKNPVFKMAKIYKVWRPELDEDTKVKIWSYVGRLVQVTKLIAQFNPKLRNLINAVSMDSLNAVKGKDKSQIDVSCLLDELQQRLLEDDELLSEIIELAQEQL